jgi:hypothetical protein
MRHFALEGSFSSAAAENSALMTLRFSMPTKARFLILRWSRGVLGKVENRSESRSRGPQQAPLLRLLGWLRDGTFLSHPLQAGAEESIVKVFLFVANGRKAPLYPSSTITLES